MVPINELQQRILAVLEEVGHENVAAVINSVLKPIGATTEVDVIQVALENLVRANLVRLATDRNPDKSLRLLASDASLEVVQCIRTDLIYDDNGGYWRWRHLGLPLNIDMVNIPEICATDAGQSEAVKILTDRGGQWWPAR